MHGKYQKLVDAARVLTKAFDHFEGSVTHPAIDDMRQALAELEPYRWLAMGLDETAWQYPYEPDWVGGVDNCYITDESKGHVLDNERLDTPPCFLRPGQLWERLVKHALSVKDGATDGLGRCTWNGYWWKLAKDYSKRCENCANMKLMCDEDNIHSWYACAENYMPHPSHGMPGCKWQAK